jgi:hypothetical protein
MGSIGSSKYSFAHPAGSEEETPDKAQRFSVAAGANPVIDPMAVVLMCLVFNLSSLSFCE